MIGRMVYVPNAYSWKWEPCLTYVKEIRNGKYVCEVPHQNYADNSGKIYRIEVEFDEVYKDYDSCLEYITNYYYGGFCEGCKYDKIAGTIWNCEDCSHLIIQKGDLSSDRFICEKCGVCVGSTYVLCHNICKYYDPTLPQNIREYVSWEHYDDILKNCEYNPDCIGHQKSCHKTCSYDIYMNQMIRIYCDKFDYDGKIVQSYLIKRKEWIDLSFNTNDGILCWGLGFAPEYTKKGQIKKGTANRVVSFKERTLIHMG